jgi:hypothetical protein
MALGAGGKLVEGAFARLSRIAACREVRWPAWLVG